jgi:histidinol-phosphate aminotransferase
VRRVYPSSGNFLLVAFSDAKSMQRTFAAAGVRIRAFDEPRLADCLRISIGSRVENDRLLAAFGQSERAYA